MVIGLDADGLGEGATGVGEAPGATGVAEGAGAGAVGVGAGVGVGVVPPGATGCGAVKTAGEPEQPDSAAMVNPAVMRMRRIRPSL